MAVSTEAIELFYIQGVAEELWRRGGSEPTALTPQEADELSLDLDLILTPILDRYPAASGRWQIPGTKSTIGHHWLVEHRGSDKITELVHRWRSERLGGPSWSATITDSTLNNGPTTIQIVVQKQGLPPRSFKYPFGK